MEFAPLNLATPVFDFARKDPDRLQLRGPLTEPRVEITRGQLASLIARRAQQLSADMNEGDRLLLIAPTTPEFVVEFFAAQSIGLTVVAVNPLATTREIDYFIDDSGANRVVAHPAVAQAGQESAEKAGIAFELCQLITPADLAELPPFDDFTPVERKGEDVAVLLYTSGTTGRPKGAMLTVSNLTNAARIGGIDSKMTEDDRGGTSLPLFHVFGLSSVLMVAVAHGTQLTLLPRFDPVEQLKVMSHDKLTVVSGVPTMWNAIVHAPEGDYDFSHMRFALSGGASAAVELIRKFEERFGAVLTEGYGLTETSAMVSMNPLDGVRKPGSVGLPLPELEYCIKDLTGAEVPAGEVGEVCSRGPVNMPGYWKREDATAEAIDEDGWFHTGDLGRVDEDGYLYIVDRLKDLIIHGGYNVYPREIEEVMYEHPGVLEAAVLGTDDDHYGQIVTAVITPMPGVTLTEEEIEKFARERLSAYKIPRIIKFVDALPKGPSGKILKRAIDVSQL